MNETRAFLEALFSRMPEGARLLIWTLPEKRSFWCQSVEEAVTQVERVRQTSNVYFGIGLLGKDFGPTKRGNAEDRIAIPALWADFDIANAAAHKKGNLPPNRQAILDLLKEAGLPPTISINSGHGLQSYWLFNDLWQFTSEEDRGKAEDLIRRWNYTLRDLARKKGWDVDSTFDLARVYRVPGTMNRKVPTSPVPVEIVHADGPRYNPADFEPYLIAEDPSLRASKAKDYNGVQVSEDLTLDPTASVDLEKFELLCEADPKFALSWDRKRKDFSDTSGSSYDMSLATIAANAGWTDQEIVNLLIHHRRKHKDDLKLRINYYRLTLFNARKGIAAQQAIERLNEMLHETPEAVEYDDLGPVMDEDDDDQPEDLSEPGEPGSPGKPVEKKAEPKKQTSEQESKRQTILRHVSDLLGFEIVNIIKYVSSEPTFRLETARGGIMLGNVNGLIKQEALRSQVAALTGFYLPKFKNNLWDTIAQSLLNAVEEQSAGEEATDEGAIRTWLRIYLSDNQPSDAGLTEENVANQFPYVDAASGRVYIFGIGFQDWLKKKYGENLGPKRLGALLRLYGASPEVVGLVFNGKKTTRSVWRMPYDTGEGEFGG